MITYLRVRNLAIVDTLELELETGLNVLTGETGAGKSLLIDSLQFLSGARGSTDLVRSGEERLTAEAVVLAPGSIAPLLDELSIDHEETDGAIELIIRRELRTNGRGRVQINGAITTVRDLQAVMDLLIEIHGQNTSSQRIGGRSYREMIDEWIGTTDEIETTRRTWASWKEVATKLEELRDAQRDRVQRLDMLEFQIKELSSAALQADEEEELTRERSELAYAEDLAEAVTVALELISENEDAAIALVGRASDKLEMIGRKVESLRPVHDDTEDALIRLQEVARTLSSIAGSIRHDPVRLDEVEERLALIDRMKRKYGDSIPQVLSYLDQIRRERDDLADYETNLERLAKDEENAFSAYREAALDLSKRRSNAAREMQQAIETHLADLAMERTRVRIDVTTQPRKDSRFLLDQQPIAFNQDGVDSVSILVATNAGEEPKPLEKVASGGELSRIQLAIAASLAERSPENAASTLVFDEIDAGVGGRVAEVVGRKLSALGTRAQVVCVTHLPQIAGMGTTHFHVWKEDVDERTRARIRRLPDESERVEELARMLAGAKITESARTHARELLKRDQPRKKGSKARS